MSMSPATKTLERVSSGRVEALLERRARGRRATRLLVGKLAKERLGGDTSCFLPGRPVRGPLGDEDAAAIVRSLRHETFPCPARGLEFVVYTAAAAGEATLEPRFELNLNTGAGVTFRADREPQPGERHWFAIDRSVLARHGVALYGAPAG